MTNKELFLAINDICEDRGLEKEKVFQAFGKGLANAYFKTTGVKNVRTVFNEEDNEYYFVEYYTVVNDDELEEGDPSKVTLKDAKKHKKGVKLGDYFEIKRTVNPKKSSVCTGTPGSASGSPARRSVRGSASASPPTTSTASSSTT